MAHLIDGLNLDYSGGTANYAFIAVEGYRFSHSIDMTERIVFAYAWNLCFIFKVLYVFSFFWHCANHPLVL